MGSFALLSRFQPDLFPSATDIAETLPSESARLAFPLEYWNGVGVFVAMGLPLLLQVASDTKRRTLRAVASGAVPILILTLYFTFSRGGTIAALAGVTLFLILATDRLVKGALCAVGIGGGVLLVVLARSRPDIRDGLLNDASRSQGDELMLLTILVCVLTGFAAWLLVRLMEGRQRPGFLQPSRRKALIGASLAAVILVVAAVGVGAPDRVSDGWTSFKSSESPESGSGRLTAANGNGRYQLWSSGLRQFESAPIAGRGAGTFEYWWAQFGDREGFVRDTHSVHPNAG